LYWPVYDAIFVLKSKKIVEPLKRNNMKKLMILFVLVAFGTSGIFAQLPITPLSGISHKRCLQNNERSLRTGNPTVAIQGNMPISPTDFYNTSKNQSAGNSEIQLKPGRTSADRPYIQQIPGVDVRNIHLERNDWDLGR
jgi:hypothetical protein